MPDNTPLAKRIYDTAHITGDFTLRSGAKSHEYFDKYLFEADPDLLKHIALAMVKLVPPGVDALAGLEMGGIPIATMLSQLTGFARAFRDGKRQRTTAPARSRKAGRSANGNC